MAVNIHITIIELNALHAKRQNLFQELDAVIHLLMEAKHWGLRKSRNATSLNSRFKSLDTLKVKIMNLASHFFDLVIGKILTSRLSLSKHLAHNLGNLLLLGKIGVFHNRRNASSRLLLLISKHLILCIYLVFRILA